MRKLILLLALMIPLQVRRISERMHLPGLVQGSQERESKEEYSMKKLEQNDYYKALNRFMAESGITDDDKKEYCQYFTVGGVFGYFVKNL